MSFDNPNEYEQLQKDFLLLIRSKSSGAFHIVTWRGAETAVIGSNYGLDYAIHEWNRLNEQC